MTFTEHEIKQLKDDLHREIRTWRLIALISSAVSLLLVILTSILIRNI